MQIRIIAVGKIKIPFIKVGCEEFLNRLKHYAKVEIIEIKDMGMNKEAQKINSLLKKDQFNVALTPDGNGLKSEQLADMIRNNDKITFIIGGPDGLSEEIDSKYKLSLSKMTFTHEMSRMILLEQLYRAHSIIKGEPYHR